jgi:hypothetical protein
MHPDIALAVAEARIAGHQPSNGDDADPSPSRRPKPASYALS